MKTEVKITKTVYLDEFIEVDLPYYYKHDLMEDHADIVIWGKIEDDKHTSIKIQENYRTGGIELEYKTEELSNLSSLYCYFGEEYKSNESQYLKANSKLISEVSGKNSAIINDEVTSRLYNLRKDFEMLRDEEWDGDARSCQDSIDQLEVLMGLLNVSLIVEQSYD